MKAESGKGGKIKCRRITKQFVDLKKNLLRFSNHNSSKIHENIVLISHR